MKRLLLILALLSLPCLAHGALSAGGFAGVLASYHAPTAPNAPTGVSATGGNTQNVVNWSAGASDSTHDAATSFTLYGGTSASPTSSIYSGSATTYTHTGLTNGTPYYYRLTASNAAGTSGYTTPDATATPAAPVTAMAQYKLNNNVTDSSGNGYNATVYGTGTSYTTDKNSNSLSAITPDSGTNAGNYIGGINAVVYNQFYGTTAFTVSAWVKTGDAGGANSGVILGLGGGTPSPDNWSFQIYGHTGAVPDQIGIRHEVAGGSSNQFTITSGATISNSVWHHLAFVVTTGSVGKIYLDGSEVTARANACSGPCDSTYTAATATSGTKYATLGSLMTNSGGTVAKLNPLLGSMDDVRVYGSALTAGAISSIFSAGPQ